MAGSFTYMYVQGEDSHLDEKGHGGDDAVDEEDMI